MGSHPICPGLTMCLADFVAERKSRSTLENTTRAFGQLSRHFSLRSQVLSRSWQTLFRWPVPMRMGRLGLRSAQRCAHAAYWASWADALPIFSNAHHHLPTQSSKETDAIGCIGELRESTARLDREGFRWRPAWLGLSCET